MRVVYFASIIRFCQFMKNLIILILCIAAFACGSKKEKSKDKSQEDKTSQPKKETQTAANSWLDKYDISSESPKIIKLSSDLLEISGITFTKDDRLFAHGDEDAEIFELDKSDGKVIKKFSLGDILVVKGDFEDIAAVNEKFYLVESGGKIYEFTEGENNKTVEYKTYKTPLSSKYDVEGLCYDSETGSLLLACKEFGGKDIGKDKAVYSFSLTSKELNETPRFVIPQKEIKNNTSEGKFNPSGIARNPVSGTFFIIAARGNTIVEISPAGDIINQKDLPETVHKQAEGIAFKSDGTLFISNEGRGKTPLLVVYEMKK
jgi:uncharacterized protein YjiK